NSNLKNSDKNFKINKERKNKLSKSHHNSTLDKDTKGNDNGSKSEILDASVSKNKIETTESTAVNLSNINIVKKEDDNNQNTTDYITSTSSSSDFLCLLNDPSEDDDFEPFSSVTTPKKRKNSSTPNKTKSKTPLKKRDQKKTSEKSPVLLKPKFEKTETDF